MKKTLLLFSILITFSSFSQTLSSSPTISFSNSSGFGDHIAVDGEGGSTAITDIDIQSYGINSSGTLLTAKPLEYHDGNDSGWDTYPPIIVYNDNSFYYGFKIASSSGAEFSLLDLDFLDWGNWDAGTYTIDGYLNSVLVSSGNFQGNLDENYIHLNSGDEFTSAFSNIDEIRIHRLSGTNGWVSINNIHVSSPASPEINLKGNSTSILDGDVTPTSADHTDFGSQDMCSGTIVRTFTIENTGTSNLTLSNPVLSGAHAADFSISANPSSPVAASGSTTFQVTFNPSAAGTRSATITISNNDSNEGTYDFSIQGTGVDNTPTITVSLGNSRCDAGTLSLSATASLGSVKWYDASSAGTLLFTGSSYTTASIGTTTTYYAEAVNGSCVSAARTAVVATVGNCNTTLSVSNCGKTLTLIDDILGFTSIQDATNYEMWVEGPSGYSQTYVRNSNSNKFRMTFYTGIKYNTTYTVKVRAYVNGTWKTYGAPCNVTTPGFPVTKLQATDCGITLTTITDKLTSDPIYAATNYEYWVQGPSSYSKTKARGNGSTNFQMSWVAGLAPNTTYTVKVRSYVEGAWTAYGSACNITTPSTIIMKYQDEIEMDMLSDFNMETYPNPNKGDFTIQTTYEGTFNIVNELGQLIQTVEITKENNFEVKIEGLDNGIYFVTGTINNEVLTKKIIVQ